LIPTIQEAGSAETVTLLQVTKNDSPADSRIILHFSGLPAYRLEASGQRLDLIMRNVAFDQSFKKLPEDHSIVKMEQQRDGDETTLSFLLRRPLQTLDSSFLLPNKNSKEPATQSGPTRLVLNIHWEKSNPGQSSITILPNPAKQDKPLYYQKGDRDILSNSSHAPQIGTPRRGINSDIEGPLQEGTLFSAPLRGTNAAKQVSEPVRLEIPLGYSDVSDRGSKNRPAIMKEAVGVLRANPDGATASHIVTSDYAGEWIRFLKEYETEVTVPVPLHYSLPPFPVLAIARPAGVQSAATVNYQKIIQQSKTDGWQQVAIKLKESVTQKTTGENQEEMLLLYGESLLRAGDLDNAREILTKLHNGLPGSTIGRTAHYLAVSSVAAAGKPYDAAYELSFMQQEAGNSPLAPYLDLLQAEIALATDNLDKAELLLQEKGGHDLGQVRQLFDLRRADMLFSADRLDEALTSLQTLSAPDDILEDHPSSLAKYAAILYKKGNYQAALKQYINLTAGLYDQPEQNLALYAAAMSQYRSGNSKEAGLMLEDVIKKFPDSEGFFRARLKINDFFVLSELAHEKHQPSRRTSPETAQQTSPSPADDPTKSQQGDAETASQQSGNTAKQDDFTGFDPAALEYADIAANAPLRALREEAAFKQALAYYFKAEYEKSVELLQDFTRTNSSGALTKDAEALLVELLPVVVKDKIARKDYVDALVLAEQNRDILIGGKVKGDFLAELGLAFASLCFWNRAVRVYLYMMDIAKDKKEEEPTYLPLVRGYYEKNDFAQVEEYCRRYLADFPDGEDRAAIVHLRISGLYQTSRTDEALRLLKQRGLPQSRELHLLAGRIFFETGDYKMTEKHLAKAMDTGLNTIEPDDVLMRAEALYRKGQGESALPFYRHLEQHEAYADQAGYRIAQIHIASDNQGPGLNLLQTLVEKARSPLWRKMAAETLAMEKI
jgi:TolA-binding protein